MLELTPNCLLYFIVATIGQREEGDFRYWGLEGCSCIGIERSKNYDS